jgi:hypothetical protein
MYIAYSPFPEQQDLILISRNRMLTINQYTDLLIDRIRNFKEIMFFMKVHEPKIVNKHRFNGYKYISVFEAVTLDPDLH